MSGGQATPVWMTTITTAFNAYRGGGKKSQYLNTVWTYFTGGGKANYPGAQGSPVSLTSLTPAQLVQYELCSLDPCRLALQECIQKNLVENGAMSPTRLSSDMKTAMDNIKKNPSFAQAGSSQFSSWSADERAVWDAFHVPIIGTGLTSSPNNDPNYNALVGVYNSSQKSTGGPDWTRYYGGVLNVTDFFNKFQGLTKTQLTTLQLPTYDRRRLQMSQIRQSYKDSICTASPQSGPALTQALAPYLADPYPASGPPMSVPLTAAEKTGYAAIPAKQCSPGAEVGFSGGGRRRRRRTQRKRSSSRRH